MSNTLTYNAVSRNQIDAVIEQFGLTQRVDGVPGEVTLSGKSPLGEVVMQVAFVELSGQLSVVVIKKPALLTMSTIDGHIREALATVLGEGQRGDTTPATVPQKPAIATAVPPPPIKTPNPIVAPVVPTAPAVLPESPETKK